MSFIPYLSTTTFVPISPASPSSPPPQQQQQKISFTHFPTPRNNTDDDQRDVVAEVWTNLPDGEWNAIPFELFRSTPTSATKKTPSPSTNLQIATISIDPSSSLFRSDHLDDSKTTTTTKTFEYTYRLKRSNGTIEWLGSEGSNGRIVFVRGGEGTRTSSGLDFDGIDGNWSKPSSSSNGERGRGLHIGKFSLRDEDRKEFDLTEIVERWNEGNQRDTEGMIWEQSSRTWYNPRSLSPPNALSSIPSPYTSQLLLLRTIPSSSRPHSKLIVFFPVSTKEVCSELIGCGSNEDGTLKLRCTRDGIENIEEEAGNGYIVVVGGIEGIDTFSNLIERAVENARISIFNNNETSTSTSTTLDESDYHASLKPIQHLSICTWNALGPDFTLKSLLNWIDSLLCPLNSSPLFIESLQSVGGQVLLDDGWQDTSLIDRSEGEEFDLKIDGPRLRVLNSFGVGKGWYDVVDDDEEEKRDYCWELKRAVEEIRKRGIKNVGVWITITGYWHGLHPSFSLVPTTIAHFSSPQHEGFRFNGHVPTLSSLSEFYTLYFTSLKRSGISFIKIDNQAIVDSIIEIEDGASAGIYRSKLIEEMQRVGEEVFGRENVIHCMAHSNRIWSGSLALSNSSSTSNLPTLRNSDDYFPNEPDSHRWHVYLNSMNLILTRNLSFEPDLDMGQEDHRFGSFHLALRAFSTARIWSTDVIVDEEESSEEKNDRLGESANGWNRLLAKTKNDGMGVIQARVKAGSILSNQVLSREIMTREGGGESLKVGLKNERVGGATIGIWNCQKEGETRGILSIEDIADVVDGIEGDEDLIVVAGEPFGPTPTSSTSHPSASSITSISTSSIQQARSSTRLPTCLSRPVVPLVLPPRAIQLLTVTKLRSIVSTDDKKLQIVCLGLRDKFVGLEAIRRIEVVVPRPKSSSISSPTESNGSASTPLEITKTNDTNVQSSFPSPPNNTHVPFLFTYFSNLFTRTSSPPSTASPDASRSSLASQPPFSQISSLFRSLLRRPISTFFSEIRGVLGFALAVVVWARGTSTPKPRLLTSRPEVEKKKEEGEETIEGEKTNNEFISATTILRVELDFLSRHLAFYVSPSTTSVESLVFRLDGTEIDSKHIKLGEGTEEGIIEIDAETAWLKRTDPNEGMKGDSWIVEVEYRG